MTKKKKKNAKTSLGAIMTLMILLIYGLYTSGIDTTFGLNTTNISKDEELKVTFIDVGQADSILIQNHKENMLIDAGNNKDGNKLVKYFKELNIDKFKYVVGTHPHEDHIGGLDNVIHNFDIDTVYMPDVITTTATFEEVIDELEKKNIDITIPKIGNTFSLGSATIKIIYTGTDSSDLNNTSIILKLIYGNTSFLFPADASSEVEKKILNQDIEATVLKVGHHGSKYSTTNDFLEKVNPKYAVISVGKDNSYEHPADSTLNKLTKQETDIYRTDEMGTIVMTSDGNTIKITYNKTDTNGE